MGVWDTLEHTTQKGEIGLESWHHIGESEMVRICANQILLILWGTIVTLGQSRKEIFWVFP